MDDHVRITKILEMAAHPSTDEHTALNALRRARSALQAKNKTFAALFNNGGSTGLSRENLPYAEWRLRVLELEKNLQEVTSQLAERDREIAKLRRQVDNIKKVAPRLSSSPMSWLKFATLLSVRNGSVRGMEAEFARHMDIPQSQIAIWKAKDEVPPEAEIALGDFVPSTKPKVTWTFDLDDEIMLLLETKTEREVEAYFRAICRPIALGSIKKVRQRYRVREEVLTIYDSGITEPRDILTEVLKRFDKSYGGVSVESIKRVLLHYRGI